MSGVCFCWDEATSWIKNGNARTTKNREYRISFNGKFFFFFSFLIHLATFPMITNFFFFPLLPKVGNDVFNLRHFKKFFTWVKLKVDTWFRVWGIGCFRRVTRSEEKKFSRLKRRANQVFASGYEWNFFFFFFCLST